MLVFCHQLKHLLFNDLCKCEGIYFHLNTFLAPVYVSKILTDFLFFHLIISSQHFLYALKLLASE